jgi:restriction endonuclease S subunit
LPEYEFEEPAVVLSSIGARCGKCFYAEGKWASLANTLLIFPDRALTDCRFLWYQLNDERRWARSGTGQPFIKPSDVKKHRVVLPPLSEQRRIVEILDQADALRAKRAEADVKVRRILPTIFIEMFGDPILNSKQWPLEALGNLKRLYLKKGWQPVGNLLLPIRSLQIHRRAGFQD